MAKPDLTWGDFPPEFVVGVLDYVSIRGGTVVLMFGGYGYYYKISWQYEEPGGRGRMVKGYATGETETDLMRCVRKRLYGLQSDM